MSVSDKKSDRTAGVVILLLVIFLFWILPAASRENVRTFFNNLQAPTMIVSKELDELKNGIELEVVPRRKLVKFCRELLRENMFLQLKLSEAKNAVIDEFTGSLTFENFVLLPARVIRRGLAFWTDEVTINVGACDGVTIGMGVMSKNCVVGRISAVEQHTSTVQLVTSPQFRMVVNIEEDDEKSPIIFSGGEQNDFKNYYGRAANVPREFLDGNNVLQLVT